MTRRLTIGLWLLGLVVTGVLILRTPFSTDMSAFTPRSPRLAQQLLVDQLREGVVSRMVLVAIDQAAPEAVPALSRAVAARLRGDDRFALIANGDTAAMARDQEVLFRNRYLLSDAVTPEHFSVDGLHRALQADLALLGSDMASLAKRALPADPTGEIFRLVQREAGGAHPRSEDGVWVSADGAQALLMVSSRAAGFDIDAQEANLAAIAMAFSAARAEVPGAADAHMITTGPPVFAVATRARIKSDAERFSIIATVLVAVVLLLAYRSVVVLVLGLLPVLSGALAGVAAVGLAFGFVHGITLGFGVTLIGEAVDYAVYLFTQTAPGSLPRSTLRRIWPTLRLGMMTSVCGFSAMLLSDFIGFAQLGLFTIVGLVTALATTRFVLPDLLPRGFAAVGATGFATPVLVLIRHRSVLRWGVLGVTIAAVLSLALHGAPYWQDELSSMSPVPAADLAVDQRLRGQLGAPDVRVMLVVTAADREAALQGSEAVAARLDGLVKSGDLGGFDAPSRFLPSLAVQRARQAALPEAAVLRNNLAEALVGLPLRGDIFAPFVDAVAAARAAPPLERGDLDGTALALQVDSLLVRHGSAWTALLPLHQVKDAAALETLAGSWPSVVFLDLKRESDRLLGSYRREAQTLSIVGALLIVALLAACLRRFARITAVVLPMAASVAVTACLVLAWGGRLSIFNLFGLLLVVAIGSNYALFFERGDEDMRRMVASLMLADLCTIIGFGILGFSQVPVLHGIGSTVAVGAGLSLVFSAILSPRRA